MEKVEDILQIFFCFLLFLDHLHSGFILILVMDQHCSCKLLLLSGTFIHVLILLGLDLCMFFLNSIIIIFLFLGKLAFDQGLAMFVQVIGIFVGFVQIGLILIKF